MSELTKDERLWIAQRLLSRARLKQKGLHHAVNKGCHPELIRQLQAEIKQCTYMAEVLSDGALEQISGEHP